MTGKVAVILGGTGMVGANMAQLLDREGDWDVTIVSRRAPEFRTQAHAASGEPTSARCSSLRDSSSSDVTTLSKRAHGERSGCSLSEASNRSVSSSVKSWLNL